MKHRERNESRKTWSEWRLSALPTFPKISSRPLSAKSSPKSNLHAILLAALLGHMLYCFRWIYKFLQFFLLFVQAERRAAAGLLGAEISEKGAREEGGDPHSSRWEAWDLLGGAREAARRLRGCLDSLRWWIRRWRPAYLRFAWGQVLPSMQVSLISSSNTQLWLLMTTFAFVNSFTMWLQAEDSRTAHLVQQVQRGLGPVLWRLLAHEVSFTFISIYLFFGF